MGAFPTNISGFEWLVDEINMNCPAWWVLNPQVLLQGPTVITSNRQQAGTEGRKGYPQLNDQTSLTLRFAITGAWTPDGDPNDDPLAGFAENYLFLRTNVFDAAWPLRTSTLLLPGDVELTAPIQFEPFPLDAAENGEIEGNLGIILPTGSHTA